MISDVIRNRRDIIQFGMRTGAYMSKERGPLVTIIVPVYNVEQYLDRCIDSILKQSYTNIEVIMVDDGSNDSSGSMCDTYASRDSRITVIHQDNRGLSGARNRGLDVMHGEYVMFIDSDDTVESDIVYELYDNIIKYDCEIAESNFVDIYNNRRKIRWHYRGKVVCNTEKALKYDISGVGGVVSACGKLYKRKIFDEVRFPLGKLGEDGCAIIDIVSKANKVVIDDRPFYHYYHRENSITTNQFHTKFFDNIEAYKRNYELVVNDYPCAVDAVLYRLDWSYIDIADRILVSDNWETNKYLHSVMKHIKTNKKRILKSKYMRRNRKIGVCLMLLNRRLYRYVLLRDAKLKNRI